MKALAAVLLATLSVAIEAQAAERRVAILLGNDRAGDREPLRWATRDAREMADVLKTLAGVDETHLLLGEGPDQLRATWTKVQDDLARDRTPATLFFFYSGHADESGLLMNDERYPFAELRRTLERMPVRLFVAVIDACQSGALARAKGGSAVPVVRLDVRDANAAQEGGVYITSGAFGEAAQESDDIESSFFTHYLVSGLRGAADDSGDRKVSLEEAYRFAYTNTLARTQSTLLGAQHPSWQVNVQGQGQLVLTWLDQSSSFIVFSETSQGRWFVKSRDRRDIFVETEKRAGSRLRIAVEPGAYEVARTDGALEWVQTVRVKSGEEVAVDEARLTSRPLSINTRKGGQGRSSFLAGYRFSGGYLQDASAMHGGRLSFSYGWENIELSAIAHYGEAHYLRRELRAVELRELGAGAGLGYRRRLIGPLGWIAGAEVLVVHARQNENVSTVVPFAARAGAALEISTAWSLELSGALGGIAYRGPEELRVEFLPALDVAMRYTP